MARAPRRHRAYGSVLRNTPPNTTLIASFTTRGVGPSLVRAGGVDPPAFVAYMKQGLAPTLRPGQVVLLDHLRVHKHPRVQAAVTARGGSRGSYRPIPPTSRRSSWRL